jgi:hypothetical protein
MKTEKPACSPWGLRVKTGRFFISVKVKLFSKTGNEVYNLTTIV